MERASKKYQNRPSGEPKSTPDRAISLLTAPFERLRATKSVDEPTEHRNGEATPQRATVDGNKSATVEGGKPFANRLKTAEKHNENEHKSPGAHGFRDSWGREVGMWGKQSGSRPGVALYFPSTVSRSRLAQLLWARSCP